MLINTIIRILPHCLSYEVQISLCESHLNCHLQILSIWTPSLKSLRNDKILDWTKLKAVADDKLNFAKMIISLFGKVEKHCGKRTKCWLPAFSPLATMLSKGLFYGVDESRVYAKMIISLFLEWTKLKAVADDKLNFAKMIIFLFGKVENTVGKGENAGYQHFLLFPLCFLKAS